MSTETIRVIREVGEGVRLYTYCYTVTSFQNKLTL